MKKEKIDGINKTKLHKTPLGTISRENLVRVDKCRKQLIISCEKYIRIGGVRRVCLQVLVLTLINRENCLYIILK